MKIDFKIIILDIFKSIFLFTIIFLISLGELWAENSISRFSISLHSEIAGNWFANSDLLDAGEYFEKWKSKQEPPLDWKPIEVPGSVSSVYPTPFPKNFKVFLKKEFLVPNTPLDSHLSILLGDIADRDKTYLNGVLIGSTGKFDDEYIQADGIRRIYEIPEGLLKPGEMNLLLVEVQAFHNSSMGIIRYTVEIASTSYLNTHIRNEDNIKLYFISFYLSICFTFLLLYYFRREKIEYFYFGTFILLYIIFQFIQLQFFYKLGIPFQTIEHISYILAPLLFTTFFHFLLNYFHYKYLTFYKIIDGLVIISRIILIFIYDIKIHQYILSNFIVYIYFTYLIIIIYLLLNKVVQKNIDSYYMTGAFLIFSISIVMDILSTIKVIILPPQSFKFFFFFVASLAVVLLVNIQQMRIHLEKLNVLLEKRVIQKTNDLNVSIDNIKKLKEREDDLHFLVNKNLKDSAKEIKFLSEHLLELQKIDPEQRLNVISNLINGSEKLYYSLENLISWTKLQSGITTVINEKVSAKELITNSLGVLKELGIQRGISLKFNLVKGVLELDSHLLGFILRNLFGNAIQFTPKNGSVTVTTSILNSDFSIIIEDTGIGIENQKLSELNGKKVETVFENPLESDNFGMGLYLCYKYIQMINGSLEMESEVGKGTKVTIFVPNCVYR
jgi:signal transduction histidine kinase